MPNPQPWPVPGYFTGLTWPQVHRGRRTCQGPVPSPSRGRYHVAVDLVSSASMSLSFSGAARRSSSLEDPRTVLKPGDELRTREPKGWRQEAVGICRGGGTQVKQEADDLRPESARPPAGQAAAARPRDGSWARSSKQAEGPVIRRHIRYIMRGFPGIIGQPFSEAGTP